MFEKENAVLPGISVDGVFCHQVFRENRGFKMTLLSDFEPKGAVAKNTAFIATATDFLNVRCSSLIKTV